MAGSPPALQGADTVSFDDEFMQYCYKVRRGVGLLALM
jgi:hypothetical protein